ncbi:anaphase-promoting complex subunit 5-domain-containing protein [Gongronella butleri]|nr:anaphase-promoting complex subunit 5-domain-containing protein [Gongronella butleri]
MDSLFDRGTSMPLVIRTPFITPFKVVLLYLIYEFCHFQLFSARTIPSTVKYLVECVLKTKETYVEPEFAEILEMFESFDHPPQNMVLVDMIRNKLTRMVYPENLYQFMQSLNSILEINDEDMTGDCTVLESNSLFGLYARRCRVEFLRCTTQQKGDMFEIFRGYVTERASSKQLIADSDGDAMTVDSPRNNKYMSVDPIGLDSKYRLDGWISDDQIDKFLTRQAKNMERTGTTDISATLLDRHLDFLQKLAPDLSKIYQVRYLNQIRTYDYDGAVANLHRFYDNRFHYREKPMYQYGLLSRGILETRFDHKEQALHALDEAAVVARECQDSACLNEVQSWIAYLKGKTSDDLKTFGDKVEEDGLKNATYLQTMRSILSVRDMLKTGEHPVKVFEALYQSGILSYLKGIEYVVVPHFTMTGDAWQLYGNHLLAETYYTMALRGSVATLDDLEQVYNRAIETSLDAGAIDMARDYIDKFQTRYDERAQTSVKFIQLRARLAKIDHPDASPLTSLDNHAAQLAYFHDDWHPEKIDAMIRNAEDQLKDSMDHTAFDILDKLLEFTEKHPLLQSNCLIQLGRIYLASATGRKILFDSSSALFLRNTTGHPRRSTCWRWQ